MSIRIERTVSLLALLLAILIDIAFLSLALPDVASRGPRLIWVYYAVMIVLPWGALLAWKWGWNVGAAILFLATNVPFGGLIPFYAPLAIGLAAAALVYAVRKKPVGGPRGTRRSSSGAAPV